MTSTATSDGPDWVRETIALTREEIRRWIATFVGSCLHPSRFSAAWVSGETRGINPLGSIGSSFAITGVLGALTPWGDSGNLWQKLLAAAVPYTYYVAVALLCHPLLRLAGSPRALRATVAIALFAGVGPGLVVALNETMLVLLRTVLFGPFDERPMLQGLPPLASSVFTVLLIYVPLGYFVVNLALSLSGLHALPRWRVASALLVALTILGLVLGELQLTYKFGIGTPHLGITIQQHRPVIDIWN